jgi:aryl-alcohol dehydrogenase-like predicted oxidoreductase
MQNRILGRTGVSVSSLCLGTMMFGPWGNADEADSIRIIHRALDVGINFVDTADVYSDGESERIVGKALAGRRDDVVLATKFFMPMGAEPNHRGGSRRWIMRSVEDSLRRLGTDYIDLYQVHRPSQDTDIQETLSALTDLVRQGKVRYIGSSSYAASQIVEAQWAARDRRLDGSSPSNRPTRSWCAASRPTSYRPPTDMAWASSPTARSEAVGCLAGGARTTPRPRHQLPGRRRAST